MLENFLGGMIGAVDRFSATVGMRGGKVIQSTWGQTFPNG